MVFQSDSEIGLVVTNREPKNAFRSTFLNRDFLRGAVHKAEYAFTVISLFLFTDAITMNLLSQGVSEGDVFSYDTMNFAPVQLFYLINYGITQVSC